MEYWSAQLDPRRSRSGGAGAAAPAHAILDRVACFREVARCNGSPVASFGGLDRQERALRRRACRCSHRTRRCSVPRYTGEPCKVEDCYAMLLKVDDALFTQCPQYPVDMNHRQAEVTSNLDLRQGKAIF